MNCPVITHAEVVDRRFRSFTGTRIPMATRRWHEGLELLGYYAEGDSFIFRGDGHYACISRGYIEAIAKGDLDFTETDRD